MINSVKINSNGIMIDLWIELQIFCNKFQIVGVVLQIFGKELKLFGKYLQIFTKDFDRIL